MELVLPVLSSRFQSLPLSHIHKPNLPIKIQKCRHAFRFQCTQTVTGTIQCCGGAGLTSAGASDQDATSCMARHMVPAQLPAQLLSSVLLAMRTCHRAKLVLIQSVQAVHYTCSTTEVQTCMLVVEGGCRPGMRSACSRASMSRRCTLVTCRLPLPASSGQHQPEKDLVPALRPLH